MLKPVMALSLILLSSVCYGASSLEEGIVRELSLARTEPKAYAGHIKEFRKRFEGKYYTRPGSETRIITKEGTPAVDEALAFLSRQKPMAPLKWSAGLARAAAELAEDQAKNGATGHVGKKSGDMQSRIERHGQWNGTIGENITYGPDEARLVVMQLIIDDGVKDRGHRTNIYNVNFGSAGAACAKHPVFRTVCVIDLAGEFIDGREGK